MRITGIVCEYNPFHNGHKYLIDKLREMGSELIVCVMSGSFVQRGECAVADKFTRAACAVAGGADLVVELPFPYSISGAEFFAAAGVGILDMLGVDSLGFGSESGDAQRLTEAARVMDTAEFAECYRRLCRSGRGSAAAVFEAMSALSGDICGFGSNDILALAYIREVLRRGDGITPTVVTRVGGEYGSSSIPEDGGYPSATALRKYIKGADMPESIRQHMPVAAYDCLCNAVRTGTAPSQMKNIERDIISFLRISDPSSFGEIADVGEGLAERICALSATAVEYESLVRAATTANYTSARVRRGILNMMLGVRAEDVRRAPAYVQLLAANQRGRAYLASRRREESLPVITKPADAAAISGGERQFELCRRAEALWCMTLPDVIAADTLIKRRPVML